MVTRSADIYIYIYIYMGLVKRTEHSVPHNTKYAVNSNMPYIGWHNCKLLTSPLIFIVSTRLPVRSHIHMASLAIRWTWRGWLYAEHVWSRWQTMEGLICRIVMVVDGYSSAHSVIISSLTMLPLRRSAPKVLLLQNKPWVQDFP